MQSQRGTVTLVIGLPGSGKTTWAQHQRDPFVCADALRRTLLGQCEHLTDEGEAQVLRMARQMCAALLDAGHRRVLLEADSHDRVARARWRDPRWKLEFVVLQTPRAECERRVRAAGRAYLVDAIDRLAQQWEPPSPDEADRFEVFDP